MHGADEHVNLVALDQLVGVLRRFCRFGFVVYGEVFQFPTAELAASFSDS